MNDVVKAKQHDRVYACLRKGKVKGLWIAAGLTLIVLFAVFRTSIMRFASMGVERLQIYIEEYTSTDTSSEEEAPSIDQLYLDTVTMEDEDLADYKTIIMWRNDLYTGNLILINGQNACRFLETGMLTKISLEKNEAYKLVDETLLLNEEMLTHFNQMMKDFEEATNKHDMIITSGYRDMAMQEEVLQEKINLFGEEEGLKWAMLPGFSEHHSGYAVDLSIYTDQGNYIRYRGQDEYGWINQNCYRYGLVKRYNAEKQMLTGVKDEAWHYRYIGVPHSYILTEKDFCLEEYIAYLKQFPYDKQHLQVECELGRYEIYYVPATEGWTQVPVPKDEAYDVSGNNVDGYIVTVKEKIEI